MKNAKRIISMLLVLVMALGLLAGCKKKEETKADEGDRTLTVGIPQDSNIADYDTNAFSLYLEETLNIDIEWDFFARNGANYQRQLTLRCTGEEDLPDVILLKMSHYLYNQFGEDGYIMDLRPLIDKYGKNFKQQLTLLDEEYQQFIWDKGTNTVTGGFYSMPLVCGVFVDNLQTMAYINQDWLNKVNKKVPTTIDELYDVLTAWKAYGDLNGNGDKQDELLMVGDGIRQVIHNAYVELAGNNWNVKDGKLWDPLRTQEFRDSVIFLNKLTKEGLVDKLTFSINGNTEYKQLVSPVDEPTKVGIWTGHYATRSNPSGDHLKDFVAWAPLQDKTGKGGYTIYSPHMVDWGGMISAECKKPQLAMEFLDVFYLDETVARMRHGKKDVDWTYGEGTNLQGTTSFVNVVPGHEQAWFYGGMNVCMDNFLGVMVPENYLTVVKEDESKLTVHGREGNRLYREFWSILQTGKKQEEMIGDLFYTPEEYDVREAKAGNMTSYASEEVINFIANEKDPNVQANWDEYYKKLDQLGRKELEGIAQTAYTRKMSNK